MKSHSKTSWLVQPQNKLGVVGLTILLVVTSLVTPLSLDMYLPAVPYMPEYFSTSADAINITLIGYFLFFAISLLIFGPFSDKYGRKRVLLAGIIVYTMASSLCAFSYSIELLIAARVLQAIGAGAVSAVSTAIVKDVFIPEKRELILSIVQVMFVVGPVLAPVIGAWVIVIADWHMTFWILTIIGAACTILSLLYEETLPQKERYKGTVMGSIKLLGVVAKNKGFTIFLIIVSLFNIAFMAYIAVGSYIYISFFGLTELEFSYFFAASALLTASGPFIWLIVSKFMSARSFTTLVLICGGAAGVGILLVGELSPFIFFVLFLIFALAESCARPYSTNILLSQQDDDTGAAASLINFAHTAIGCLGMGLAVLPWTNYVVGIGTLIVISMILALVIWAVFLRSSIPLKGISKKSKTGAPVGEAGSGEY